MTAATLRQVPHTRRRSILGHLLAKARTASLNLYSTLSPVRAYALPAGALTCFAVGAFTLATWAGWGMVGVGMLVLDWYRDNRQ